MTEDRSVENPAGGAPQAVVQTRRQFSLIWVVPIVAVLIGGWLAYKAVSEKGPEIAITFENADGLEAEKTKIKFKDVEIGKVTAIELDPDLTHVIVTAEMNKGAEPYLTDQTRFWVVRARVAAGEVSGLGTLFSGAYIGCDPAKAGKSTRQFKGLEKPPVVTGGLPGRHYVLEANSLGSLDIGSPVYYRGLKVGQVVEYGFDELAEYVNVRVFINAPYHEKVRQNTRFWNASGIDFKLDTEGVKVDTQSLVSIMLGGVSFDLPQHLEAADPAEEDRVFQLYETRERIEERTYTVKRYFRMYFDQNVRGLSPGAPVEIKGIRLGEVVDVKLEIDADKLAARVAVLALLEPERIDTIIRNQVAIAGTKNVATAEQAQQNLARLVEKGLRAQLKTGNLLTGQLYVDLDFYPDAPKASLVMNDGYGVMPTVPAPLEQITESLAKTLKKIEKIPFDQIGGDLQVAIQELRKTLAETGQVAGGINREVLPKVAESLTALEQTLSTLQKSYGDESAVSFELRRSLSELGEAARSIRFLADYLQRHPEALLYGKGDTQ